MERHIKAIAKELKLIRLELKEMNSAKTTEDQPILYLNGEHIKPEITK